VRKLLSAVVVPVLAACAAGDAKLEEDVAAWRVDVAPVLEIGEVEGDSAYQLFDVHGIAELPGGGVAIANTGTSQVRLYDAEGRFQRAIGRQGEGPGEFSMLLDLRVLGDTLYAYDRMAGRLTRFLLSGPYLDDRSLRPSAAMMTPNFAGLLPDGASAGSINVVPAERTDGFQRQTMLLLRFGPSGVDTLATFPGPEVILRTRAMPGNMTVMTGTTLPYYRIFLATAGDDRIYAASTDSALIHVWDGAGRPRKPISWEDTPLPVDDALVAGYIERIAERDTRGLDAPAAASRRRVLEEAERPATAPLFDRMRLGPDGELWVRRFAPAEQADAEWLIFDREGALRARLRIPWQRDIRALGRDRVYTLERDEYDVEHVRGYVLRRSGD
jgi:hypothetical protein